MKEKEEWLITTPLFFNSWKLDGRYGAGATEFAGKLS